VAKMKNYLFYREDNKFDDILSDKNMMKYFKQKLTWRRYLYLLSYNVPEEVESYIMLKYGDDVKPWDNIRKDNSPVPYVDYLPDSKRPKKFKNVYK
jgi:hypothetical protein